MLTTAAEVTAFSADACKKMESFVTIHRTMAYQRRAMKRRFERFVITKRAELHKGMQHQLAHIERISKATANWAADAKKFVAKHNNITQDEAFCERFIANDVCNSIDEAVDHTDVYRTICNGMIEFEEHVENATAEMAKVF
jgi:hypothetical protein